MNGGPKPRKAISEEARRHMAEARRGKKWDEATKAKMRAAKLGKKQTEEHRRNSAEARRGQKRTPEQRANISAATKGKMGHLQSPEVQAKRAATLKAKLTGVPRSEEVKAKVSASKRTKPHQYTDEQRAKMSASQKRYFATMTDEERREYFANLVQAGKEAQHTIPMTDTTIEVFVEGYLRGAGIEFEHPFQAGRFEADFYIPAINTIVEVQGCYWHGCEQCGFEGEHAEMQREKDRRRFGYFKEQGYKTKTVWEHEIRQNTMENLLRIVEKVNESRET